MDKEIWKDIDGYESVYQISNLGRVRSLRDCNQKPREKILSPYKSHNGYLQINLVRREKKSTFKLHRLVAQAFIPNPENKPEVNHIDGNKSNNHISNLEWCTHSENMQHAVKSGLVTQKHIRKLTEQDVQTIRKEYIKGSKGSNGVLAMARKYNVCEMTIYKILQGKSYKNIK